MSPLELLTLVGAGFAAGSINGAIGSGSLVTLPILLAMGLPPETAITTNTIALVLSALGGVVAYRSEIIRDLPQIRGLIAGTLLGAILGAVALITTPPGALRVIVPVLIAVALILVVLQPRISAYTAAHAHPTRDPYHHPGLHLTNFGISVYGGYFAAAQGIMFLAALASFTGHTMKQVNGIKNALALVVNLTAAFVYTVGAITGVTHVWWAATAALATGALIGGYTGGYIAQRVPAAALRWGIIAIASMSFIRAIISGAS